MDTRNQKRQPQHPYRGRKVRFPSVSEYCTMLRDHVFTFRHAKRASDQSPQELELMVQNMDREMYLYRLAWEGGDEYMQALSSFMSIQREQLIPRKTQEDLAAEAIIQITDTEIMEYALRLERFDWYHSFSDDGAVLRNGAAGEEALKKIANEKGGMYKQLWDLYTKKRSDNLSKR